MFYVYLYGQYLVEFDACRRNNHSWVSMLEDVKDAAALVGWFASYVSNSRLLQLQQASQAHSVRSIISPLRPQSLWHP